MYEPECEVVESSECRLTWHTWKSRDQALSALSRALAAHASCPTTAQNMHNNTAQCHLPRLQPADSNCSSDSSVASQSQWSPTQTIEPHDTCERCDSIGAAGIAREAVAKAAHVSGAKEYLVQGLVVWLAAQVEEKVFSGALNLDGYLATMGEVAHAVASMSCDPRHSQGMLPLQNVQVQLAKKSRVDFVEGGGALSLGSAPEWARAASLRPSFGCQESAASPTQPIMPGGVMGLAPGSQDAIDDVSWTRHQLLKDRYLLHLQVCHLASLTRIQEHFAGVTAPGGSARATRVMDRGNLRTLEDMKRIAFALVRFLAATRERVPSRFNLHKLDCLENVSRSVLSAMRSMTANGTLSVPRLLLRGVPGGPDTDMWQQGCHSVYQRKGFTGPLALQLPPAADVVPSKVHQLQRKRPWCKATVGREGMGSLCFVECNSDSPCQSTVLRRTVLLLHTE